MEEKYKQIFCRRSTERHWRKIIYKIGTIDENKQKGMKKREGGRRYWKNENAERRKANSEVLSGEIEEIYCVRNRGRGKMDGIQNSKEFC